VVGAAMQFASPSLVHAAQNTQAIELRRVMEQPEPSVSTAIRAIADPAPVASKTVTLDNGVRYYDVKVGEGNEAVVEGKTVQFQWVLRRSNGYFVDASANYGEPPGEPFIYKVGNLKKVIKGLDEGIRGMKKGGIRRLTIPPEMAFQAVNDDAPGPMPGGFGPRRQLLTRLGKETWYFEIQLIKIK